jgi:hypothetical protein
MKVKKIKILKSWTILEKNVKGIPWVRIKLRLILKIIIWEIIKIKQINCKANKIIKIAITYKVFAPKINKILTKMYVLIFRSKNTVLKISSKKSENKVKKKNNLKFIREFQLRANKLKLNYSRILGTKKAWKWKQKWIKQNRIRLQIINIWIERD